MSSSLAREFYSSSLATIQRHDSPNTRISSKSISMSLSAVQAGDRCLLLVSQSHLLFRSRNDEPHLMATETTHQQRTQNHHDCHLAPTNTNQRSQLHVKNYCTTRCTAAPLFSGLDYIAKLPVSSHPHIPSSPCSFADHHSSHASAYSI